MARYDSNGDDVTYGPQAHPARIASTNLVRPLHLALIIALVATILPSLQRAASAAPPPASGFVYSGFYDPSIQTTPFSEGLGTAKASFDALEGYSGRRATFGGLFQGISDPDSTEFALERVWQAQATPVVNIEIHDTAANIAAGNYDAQLDTWAAGIKPWFDQGGGRSAIFAPLQEMNGKWTVWGCDPANWKAAYNRIRDRVRAAGMTETSVRWAFAPNGWSDPGCGAGANSIAPYYPGDAVTDLVGISAYNYGQKEWDGKYRFPAEVYGQWLNELRGFAPDKPFLIVQTGTAPATRPSDDRDGWLRELHTYLAADPNVVGYLYFNLDKSPQGGNEWDWRVWYGTAGDNRNAAGLKGMSDRASAYAWPLSSWFRPGALAFGPVARMAGSGRVVTSVKISEAFFDASVSTVLIATSGSYPDALAGAPLAAKLAAPILLTSRDALDAATKAEIQRLAPTEAIMLGGQGALSEQVRADLEAIVPSVRRIGMLSGGNRFDTAAKISTEVGGVNVYVVEGENADPRRGWPDAVSVSALAAYQQRPIVLTRAGGLPAESLQLIRDLGVTNATIVGGIGAVSENVEAELVNEGITVERVSGTSRYSTSQLVAERMVLAGMDAGKPWLATGENWPDALAAAPALARDGGVLLLVHGLVIEGSRGVRDWVRLHDPQRVLLIGGPNAITAHVEGEMYGLAR